MKINEKIRVWRKEKKIGQKELANLIGKSVPCISRFEKGKQKQIEFDDIEKMLHRLDKKILIIDNL